MATPRSLFIKNQLCKEKREGRLAIGAWMMISLDRLMVNRQCLQRFGIPATNWCANVEKPTGGCATNVCFPGVRTVTCHDKYQCLMIAIESVLESLGP